MVETKSVPLRKPVQKRRFPILLLLASLLLSVGLYFGFRHYEDVAKEGPDGLVEIKEERLDDLQRQQEELENKYVCYKLVAAFSKYYERPGCFEGKFCLEEHIEYMNISQFENHFSNLDTHHEKYDDVYIGFISYQTDEGDFCYLEDRILFLVLHVQPTTQAMIEAFEKNYLQAVPS